MSYLPRLDIADGAYKWWALGVTIIGGFMSILDTSIVNIAIPKMMAVFSVDTDQAQWILTAYMLTMGVLQPVTGYLCDVIGMRRMYLLSLAIFTAGSALCGVAWSNDSMIAFRVIQAVGGGLIIPVTMAIVYQVFPPAERNMAMGIWGISAMVAPAVGPTLSGYLVEFWDWQLIFTINIPIGVVGYVAAALVLRESAIQRGHKFDFAGFATSALGLFCLLLALSEGVDHGWTSAYIVSLFYVGVASLILFVVIELSCDNPILEIRLFKNWNFALSTLVIFVGTIGLFGGIFLVPLFMENLRNYTAMQTGMLMFPSAVTSGLMMPVAAKLADRLGAKPVVIAGVAILAVGTLPFMYIDLDISYQTVLLVMVLRGLGLGLFMMPATVLAMNTVPMALISRASAMNNAIRQISGSLGIALLTTIMQDRQIFHLAHNAEHINVASGAFREMLVHAEKMFAGPPGAARQMMFYYDSALQQAGFGPGIVQTKALALISSIVQRQSFVFAFDDAFLVLSIIVAAALIPALLLRPVKSKAGSPPVAVTE